ncbi:PhzF family phenazine biosynthesis protein [soil metagenome]
MQVTSTTMHVSFQDLVVFTRDGAGGNPLAVIDFEAVPSPRWQEAAAAIGYSQTVFLERGDVGVAHIYTPQRRIPFAGHPLVGSAFVLGPDVEYIRYDAGVARADHRDDGVYVTVPAFGPATVTAPPQFGRSAVMIESPLQCLVVEAPDTETVASLDFEDASGHGTVYVWAWETPGEVVRARFFAPDWGVTEDAATANAAVALARALDATSGSLTIHQGEEMGWPSLLRLRWDGDEVTVGGTVGDLGRATVELA